MASVVTKSGTCLCQLIQVIQLCNMALSRIVSEIKLDKNWLKANFLVSHVFGTPVWGDPVGISQSGLRTS